MKKTNGYEDSVTALITRLPNDNVHQKTRELTQRGSLSVLAITLSTLLTAFSMQLSYAGSTIVTDAIGTDVLWSFEENLGVQNLTSKINQVDGKGITQTWDANNNMTSRTDAEGRTTTYAYNATNQRTSMTEAAGTAQARTTTYEYVSPDIDLVTRTTMPSVLSGSLKETINVYDGDLNITSTTVNGFAVTGGSVSRGTSFAYNDRGQVIEIDGPRTDISDITTFHYYDCNTGAECGQLQSVVNALGHTTTYDSYDANARLLQSTDANGIVTTNTYHPRGWLLSRTQTALGGEARTTTYEYDNVGQMTQTTSPDGIVLDYDYDAAHDLRSITDNLGNRVEYEYDAKGNRTKERTFDPANGLVRDINRDYDIRNFVESIREASSVTTLVNDAVGNVASQTDPNQNPSTTSQYDALDRLEATVDALTNTTGYEYNVADQLIQVQAPNGTLTQYDYDDLGNLLAENSADRGTTTYTHDSAGNVISQTDARSITVNYQYDALNRLTDVSFPDASESIQYSYDTCPILGIGRLCAVSHEAGSEAYAYDSWGNVIMHLREEQGTGLAQAQSHTTRYAYDTGNRVIQTTYPSGRTVDYIRDAIGRLIEVSSTSAEGEHTPLMFGRQYRADGLWTSQSYGNGLYQSKQYDIQGWLENHVAGDYNRDYGYDNNGNILDIQGSLNSLYEYDPLDRLVEDTVSDLGIDLSFDYDANGNRIQVVDNGASTPLDYQANSNRLTGVAAENVVTDPSGRTIVDQKGRFYVYNDAGRLESLLEMGPAGPTSVIGEYHYNANQLRTRKTVNGNTTIYHYDLAGNMLAESDELGQFTQEYVYADGERIAVFDRAMSGGSANNAEQNATVYEDAESGTTSAWDVYDQDPSGATISNVFDSDKSSQVIELSGGGSDNGYRLGYQTASSSRAWRNTTQKVIQWDAQFSEGHTYFVGVQTTGGFRFMTYRPQSSDQGVSTNGLYVRLGTGTDKVDGNWHTITRDLSADLKKFEPTNDILEVNGILIRGSGRIDNVKMLDQLPTYIGYEDAESGTTSAWDVYDQDPSGATISNVFDSDKSSQVIELSGGGSDNGYRLGYQTASSSRAWRNTTQKVIQWDARFSEGHTYFVGVQTTAGFRFMTYRPQPNDQGVNSSGIYVILGLGTDKVDNNWHTITRDLSADLKKFEPTNDILEVNGILIRGSGRIDNVVMLDTMAVISEPTVHYYINDHLGTPQRLLDQENQVSWEATYEAFGQATVTTENVEQNHRFPGQYYDEESQLHYNWNRYYEPETGRYVTSDPIGLDGGLNTYGYVGGNPLKYIDPTGEVAILWPAVPPLAEFIKGCAIIVAGIVIADDCTDEGGCFDEPTASPLPNNPAITDVPPQNLCEQLALAEAKAGAGKPIMSNLGDEPRLIAHYGPGPWIKKQHTHVCPDGRKLVIHYFSNGIKNVELKFV